jgi:hypothetical protein
MKHIHNNIYLFSALHLVSSDAGMQYMVGPDWMDLFDLVIVNARKPKFFHAAKNRPFRLYDKNTENNTWGRVTMLEKGKVYQQVTWTLTWMLTFDFEMLYMYTL